MRLSILRHKLRLFTSDPSSFSATPILLLPHPPPPFLELLLLFLFFLITSSYSSSSSSASHHHYHYHYIIAPTVIIVITRGVGGAREEYDGKNRTGKRMCAGKIRVFTSTSSFILNLVYDFSSSSFNFSFSTIFQSSNTSRSVANERIAKADPRTYQ